jgi:hypothetical protein
MLTKMCPDCRTLCRDDATVCDACGRDLRTVSASPPPQGKAWTTVAIALMIAIVGVVWFVWLR